MGGKYITHKATGKFSSFDENASTPAELEQSRCSLQILALPAKRMGFFAVDGALIARSDSNGEDLEAFAGAGKPYLYSFGKGHLRFLFRILHS